jgi:hypothetical protein
MKKPNLAQIEEGDKMRAAFHEAGHFVVAAHFKAAFACRIFRVGNATLQQKAFVGVTVSLPCSKLREAALGWGGLVAEEFYERLCRSEQIPSEPDECFFSDTLGNVEELSGTDRANIKDGGFRAFKIAWKTVLKKFAHIADVAEKLSSKPGVYYAEN